MKPFFGSPEALVVTVAIGCYIALLGLPIICACRAKAPSKRPYRWGFNLAWGATEYASACILCAIAATALASFMALLNWTLFPPVGRSFTRSSLCQKEGSIWSAGKRGEWYHGVRKQGHRREL